MTEEISSENVEQGKTYENVGKYFKGILAFLLNAFKKLKISFIWEWFRKRKARTASILLSHWHQLFSDWQESSKKIYSSLEEEIKQRKIPNIKISRIAYKEGGVLSAKREYLRIKRKEHIFDICAAPFGTGFFISWWLGEMPGRIARFIMLIPLIGPLLVKTFRPETYYRLDTAYMFQGAVHSAVLKVVEQLSDGKGVRALSELEKKPIMSDLFKRKF